MTVIVVVEGDTDLPIVRKLAADARLTVTAQIDCAGKDRLDEELEGYNDAAQGSPWFVLRDLDHDAQCAAEYIRGTHLRPSRWMCFRIAVRELEAWLLADSAALAEFLGVRSTLFPAEPDVEDDPTRTIVNLSRRSRRRAIQRAMIPKPGAATAVGPLYEAKIIEFGELHWDLDRAAVRSASLRGARRRLRELSSNWAEYCGAGPIDFVAR